MLENIREAFDGIWSHKLRSTLTMLGIIIGGAGNNTVEVALYQGDYVLDPSYQQVPEYVTPLDSSILPEITKIKEVEDASLFFRRDAYGMIWYGSEGLNQGSVYGVDDRFMAVNGYVIRSGRNLLPEDFKKYNKVALIDRTVSETLFMGQNPINQTIEINSEPYVVVGEFTQSSAFTPTITSIDDYFTYTDHSGGKVLIPASTWPTLFAYDHVTYKSKDLLEQAKKLQELSSATNRQLIWIASISLLVGGIGVMNIMLVSVTERTPEIGLKKALGARKRRISSQFLTEAGVLTCIGGILGIVVGIGLAYMVSRVSGVPIFISWYIVAATVIFSFIVGLFFGAVPAVQAARLNPIDALRRE